MNERNMMQKQPIANTKDKRRIAVSCAAIDRYTVQHIVLPTEKETRNGEYVEWGDGNRYPDYLRELYKTTATLNSVIKGSVDYVCGDGVQVRYALQGERMNMQQQTPDAFVRELALSYFIYGGFAIQVIRSRTGDIAELYPLDLRHLRTSKEADVFYYSEDWMKRYSRTRVNVYPKYIEGAVDVPTSILYVKNTSMQTYPEPLYEASVEACEIERGVCTYHLNSVRNGFAGSTIINFANGVPEDEIQAEIEKNVYEKFAGPENAGGTMLNFCEDREHAASVERIEAEDYADKHETAVKSSRQQIFTSFRANPNLFGIPTENLGFSSEEYSFAFKLYNRTQIRPVQKLICESVGKIMGDLTYMTITPFTLD